MELINLWADMGSAYHYRQTRGGGWSMKMEDLAERIRSLSRILGAVPWRHIAVTLLRTDVYPRVYEGMDYEPIDWPQIEELERSLR